MKHEQRQMNSRLHSVHFFFLSLSLSSSLFPFLKNAPNGATMVFIAHEEEMNKKPEQKFNITILIKLRAGGNSMKLKAHTMEDNAATDVWLLEKKESVKRNFLEIFIMKRLLMIFSSNFFLLSFAFILRAYLLLVSLQNLYFIYFAQHHL